MELKDCFIGKIVKDDEDIVCSISGLGYNSTGEVILQVTYPSLDNLHYNTQELFLQEMNKQKSSFFSHKVLEKIRYYHPIHLKEL